jgi:hypothetical protein
MKQKLILEGLKAKQEMLRLQIQMAKEQMGGLSTGCESLEQENGVIQRRIESLRVGCPGCSGRLAARCLGPDWLPPRLAGCLRARLAAGPRPGCPRAPRCHVM